MKERAGKTSLAAVAALMLMAVFAVCMLLVLLSGGRTYAVIARRGGEAYLQRTAVQYVTMRLRQGDALGAVSVSDFGGADALKLTQEIDGETYITLVYCWDGAVRELFCAADAGLSPEDGEELFAVEDMQLALSGGVVTAEITISGQTHSLTYCLRSGEGAKP